MNRFFLIFFLSALHFGNALANAFSADTISIRNFKSGLSLTSNWRYKTGDDPSASSKNYDDNKWKSVEKDTIRFDSIQVKYKGILWFRNTFYVDSTIENIPLALRIRTNSACEIFFDGKLIHSLGTVNKNEKKQISGFTILHVTVPLPMVNKGFHTIALRTTNFGPNVNFGLLNVRTTGLVSNFQAEVLSMKQAIEDKDDIRIFTIPIFFMGVFIVLSIFHFILFLHYRRNRSNLYYSLLTFLLFLLFFGFYTTISGTDVSTVKSMLYVIIFSLFLVPLFFLGILYEVFYKRLLKMFWILAITFFAALVLLFIFEFENLGVIFIMLYLIASFVESIRVYIRGWIKKRDGSRIFIFGLFYPVIGVILLEFIVWILEKSEMPELASKFSDHLGEFFAYSTLMSVSFSMTIYLARDFARMNRTLQDQIKEIRNLFDQTVKQEKERKQILENQNTELERMVAFRTEEVMNQKAEIELKNRDILDNLLYARRIQEAILPEAAIISRSLPDSFIIYWPKDIVSGDFYSFAQKDGKIILCAADCTGHGVTGAFMSMIGSSLLNQIVNESGITHPAKILDQLNIGIKHALKQKETDINDGMDIAVCVIDTETLKLQFAGANRPLWYFQNGQFNEIKGDKLAIGGFRIQKEITFSSHEVQFRKNDTIYLFTDGFVDQFGELSGKKLLTKNFREYLSTLQNLTMQEQETKLTAFFNEWKGQVTQIDDVLVMGIRI